MRGEAILQQHSTRVPYPFDVVKERFGDLNERWFENAAQASIKRSSCRAIASGPPCCSPWAASAPDSGLLAASNLAPLLAIIVVGVSVGFLPHNIHPARIFMGDAGDGAIGKTGVVPVRSAEGRTKPRDGESRRWPWSCGYRRTRKRRVGPAPISAPGPAASPRS